MNRISGRNGWSREETAALISAAQAARDSDRPLRSVFAQIAAATGRQPNSVRNYYYQQARTEGVAVKAAFVPFTEAEVRSLVRAILLAQGCGQSVRAAAMSMGGDRSRMLRLQNKYRSVIRSRRELVCDIMRELDSEGLRYVNPYTTVPTRGRRPSGGYPPVSPTLAESLISEQKKCSSDCQTMRTQIAELSERMNALAAMMNHMLTCTRELIAKSDATG